MSLPPQFKEYFDHDANPSLLACKKCNSIPNHCEVVEIGEAGASNKDFISLSCTSTDCIGIGTWFVCCPCSQSFTRYSKAEKHAGIAKHLRNVERRSFEAQTTNHNNQSVQAHEAAFDSSQSNFYPLADSQETGYLSVLEDINRDSFNFFDEDDSSAHVECSQTENHGSDDIVHGHDDVEGNDVTKNDKHIAVMTGKALDSRHDWLAEMLKDSPKATSREVQEALICSPNMQRFWLAENNTPGGGLVYLVGRAFNRSNFMAPEQMPDLPEAEWHMQNFMQYVGMSEKQREWHAQITMKVTSQGSDLIKKTRIPNPQELKRFYMSDSQHSLYQALPIPQIQNIKGIAYVNPVDIVAFAFACGLPMDDISVSKDTPTGKFSGKQCHVADSQKIRNLMRKVQEKALPDENGDYRIVIAWCTQWRDGFGVNRTKNNRKSVVAWTFSVSPGKEAVNSVGNTFPMALGQKKNPAWAEVEHQVRRDTSVLNDPSKPFTLYHGGIRKMVRVFVSIINTSNDKPERADITGTLNFNGNTHRSFGRLIQIVSPACDTKRIQETLNAANPNRSNDLANGLQYGWSDQMIESGKDANMVAINGAVLPSCELCRAKNLHTLMGHFPGARTNLSEDNIKGISGPCSVCADWTMDSFTASKLPFKAPEDYPSTCAPNCPVEPPRGRCTTSESFTTVTCPATGKEVRYLSLVELDFPNLVKAMKFAFFNLVSEKSWTQGMAKAYLTANGIAPKYATELCQIAKEAKRDGRANNIDYNSEIGIDKFLFPAAWIDPNLTVKDYIETVMHELCLGVAEANFELCSLWKKNRGRDTAFRRTVQDLLVDLKGFGLNWLHTYPFSASEDPKNPGGKYGTGAWQGENWIAWIRISKIAYLHASVPLTANNPKTTGNWDVFRLVIVFTALASRAMSHSGIDDADIQEFEHFLKEFFNCVRELDIQTRYTDMKKKTKRVIDVPQEGPGSVPVPTMAKQNLNGTTGKQGGNSRVETIPLMNLPDNHASLKSHKKRGNNASKSKTKPPESKSNSKVKKRSRQCSNHDSDYEDENSSPPSTQPTTKRTRKKKQKQQAVVGDSANIEGINSSKTTTKKKKSKGKSAPKTETTGGAEAWWTRSNYLSLPNLVRMMEMFGPLINFWDGGGKGEKFVQEVKPLISRGVHEYDSFFEVIMEKLYKNRVLDIFRIIYSLFSADSPEEDENTQSRFSIGKDGEITSRDNIIENVEEHGMEISSLFPHELLENVPDGRDYSTMEDQHMFKLRTFYHYRSLQHLERALADKKPISGVLVHNESDAGKMDFYVLYKQKKSYYGKKIVFDDNNGLMVGGLWYAPMECVDATQPIPDNYQGIQAMAKMSTVAIPMSYGIGRDKPHSEKCCVITNWWKERQSNGRYTKPGLDPSYYVRGDNYEHILAVFGNDDDGFGII